MRATEFNIDAFDEIWGFEAKKVRRQNIASHRSPLWAVSMKKK